MSFIPEFNTKSPWEWPYRFMERDPETNETSPREKWDYDDIQIVYARTNGVVVGTASLKAGTLVITDDASREVTIHIPVAGRPEVQIQGKETIFGDCYGSKGTGEPEWLGRVTATLVKGA